MSARTCRDVYMVYMFPQVNTWKQETRGKQAGLERT